MEKINFTNLPSTDTPVNANNLNTMQDNIDDAKVEKQPTSYTGDLNNIKTTGFTYARGTATNIPVSGHFFYVTTIAIDANNVYQKATRLIENLKLMFTYERQCVSGTWTEWRDISLPTTVTNDNGTATKFPDGTMIACGTKKTSTNYGTITFPSSFIEVPNVAVSLIASDSNNSIYFVAANPSALTGCNFYARKNDGTSVTSEITVSWQAIGRWK